MAPLKTYALWWIVATTIFIGTPHTQCMHLSVHIRCQIMCTTVALLALHHYYSIIIL